MKRTDYINIIIFSYKALLNKGILKLTIISLLLSLVILSSMLFAFWNAFPSVQWIKILFWGVFDDLLNTIWIFIISSLFSDHILNSLSSSLFYFRYGLLSLSVVYLVNHCKYFPKLFLSVL